MSAELEWYTLRELADLTGRSAGTVGNWFSADRRAGRIADDQVDYRPGPKVKILANGRVMRLRTVWIRGDAAQELVRRHLLAPPPWLRRR